MHKTKLLFVILLLLGILSGCQKAGTPVQGELPTQEEKSITVYGTRFTVEQINEQIKETINEELYYCGNDPDSDNMFYNWDLILNKNLEYSLYYVPSDNPDSTDPVYQEVFPPQIHFVITNMAHPLSTEDEPKLYFAGIEITQKGLRSDFCRGYHISADEKMKGEFLGSYSMCLTEIVKPIHEEMSNEWKEQVETELKLYMDENDYSAIKENNLPVGNYHVYIEGFSECDADSDVIFEHEDGRIYIGTYRFLHHASGENSANLHRVTLSEYPESMAEYLNKVRENAVLSMKYAVKGNNYD